MITRIILLTIGILLLTFSVSAQDAMPTKEETVNYLHKKLMETDGIKQTKDARDPLRGHTVKLKNGKVELTQPGLGGGYGWMYSFDPAHILDVKIISVPYWEVDAMNIVFVSKLVVRQAVKPSGELDVTSSKDMEKVIQIQFIRTPGNGEKIRKAFLHLRDLAKAEDDLF